MSLSRTHALVIPERELRAQTFPLIIVQDMSIAGLSPTILYVNGSNEIFSLDCYRSTNSLRHIQPCTHRISPDSWPCSVCETKFTTLFWPVCARLLDYFADFYAHDTPHMQTMWFSLVDTWLETSLFLLVDRATGNTEAPEEMEKAELFREHFNDARQLLVSTIEGVAPSRNAVPREAVIHDPTGNIETYHGVDNTGPYISGLKPWQQFLCVGAPGSAIGGRATLEQSNGIREKTSSRHFTQQIPAPGLAILKNHMRRHIERAAALGIDLDVSNPLVLTPDDRMKLAPRSTLSDGSTANLVNSAPPIVRDNGYMDELMVAKNVSFSMLDDALGNLMGRDLYEHESGEGVGGTDDDDEEESDDQGDEEVDDVMEAFDIMVIEKTIERKPVEGGMEKKRSMFDNWVME